MREYPVPRYTLEDLSAVTVLDALRLDGLVQLLVQKGVITREELLQSTKTSAETRMDKVIELLTLTPDTPPTR